MTTLTDRLAYPNLRKVFLLEVTAGVHLHFWTLTGGSTYTYEIETPYRILDVKENGVSLSAQSSTATVESTTGSWWWSFSVGKVYVHPSGDDSPYGYTFQGMAGFYFTNDGGGRIYNSIYYQPRLKSMPSLSVRVEEAFGNVGQIGAGNITLNNEDGYFDTLTDLQWDAGTATLKLGVDNPLWT